LSTPCETSGDPRRYYPRPPGASWSPACKAGGRGGFTPLCERADVSPARRDTVALLVWCAVLAVALLAMLTRGET